MIKSLRYIPDPILLKKTQKVKKIDLFIITLVQDMIDTLIFTKGVGLAANQIGIPLRIAVIKSFSNEKPLVLINPQIVKKEGTRYLEEACLSIPKYSGKVKRSENIEVKALDLDWKPIKIIAKNSLITQVLEHEIDHLDGFLYIEKIK